MEKLINWLVLIIGVLLILPQLSVTQLGTLTTGFTGWAIPLAIIAIGIISLTKN